VWLLDANLDIRIQAVLAEFGIDSRTAEAMAWKELSNGHLVQAAVEAGFTCLLTRDQLFAESASKALKRFPEFAVVLIRLRQEKWPAYIDSFPVESGTYASSSDVLNHALAPASGAR
jgi:hypothetical protein